MHWDEEPEGPKKQHCTGLGLGLWFRLVCLILASCSIFESLGLKVVGFKRRSLGGALRVFREFPVWEI